MVFKGKPDKRFAFKLLIIIFLFGTVQILLIPNYLELPKISEEKNYIFGFDNLDFPVVQKKFSWDIDFNDHKISNIENIFIWIFTLWGFMKCIDLMFFLEKYKKD